MSTSTHTSTGNLRKLFANLCLHAYVAETEPAELPVHTTWSACMKVLSTARVRHHSLKDFERLYVGIGPENYGWYQLRLHAAARDIYEYGGTGALRRMYGTFAAQGGKMTDRRLLVVLEASVSPSSPGVARLEDDGWRKVGMPAR